MGFWLPFFWAALCLGAEPPFNVSWPGKAAQGGVFVVTVSGSREMGRVEGKWGDQAVYFFAVSSRSFAALSGVDLEKAPGKYGWSLSVIPEKGRRWKTKGEFDVAAGTFPVQRLNLPEEMVEFDQATRQRVDREMARLKAIFKAASQSRYWAGGFDRPVKGVRLSSNFGLQRIMNEKPGFRHTGVDFRGATGKPVRSINRGRVALVATQYLGGNMVVIDHGLGLYSVYSHLHKVLVEEGKEIQKGQTIGQVGQTGRATGPHLHFAVRLNEARVDPVLLLRLKI
ncbi:MAG: M23 family metallopeptidase [Elusimicrobia bacterium]|nr:M23 family metallopeptidase [Elusimicrobiota bacterium]